MIPKADLCIFCGSGEIAKEHIFARKWLERIWDLPKGHKLPHHHVRGHSVRGEEFDRWWLKQEADLVVYCVCGTCNSGWMNDLDQQVHPIVDPMTRGESTTLTRIRDQNLLVRWAIKIAFMFDYRQDRSTIPTDFARAFHQVGSIPPNTYIWLARNKPLHDGQASGMFHTMGRSDDHPEIYLNTFRVDELVLQVLIGIAKDVEPRRLRHGDAVVQIWPQSLEPLPGVIRWPPRRTLDELEYAAFGNAFIRDYFEFG